MERNDEADAPRILFLHGIPDTGRVWYGVISHLSAQYHCRAPDLPGFGSRPPLAQLASLEDLAEAVDAMTTDLPAYEPVTLAVHNIGGLFGLAWATTRPERVNRLIILNTSIFPDRKWHWGAKVLRTPIVGGLAMDWLPRFAFRVEMRRASRRGIADATIDGTYDRFGPAARAAALALYRLQTPGLLSGLPEAVERVTASIPTLVIWGGSDPYLPTAFASRFGAADVRVHDRLGHWPHQEDPAQVATDIQSFMMQSAPHLEHDPLRSNRYAIRSER